jgi:hypothetical protein
MFQVTRAHRRRVSATSVAMSPTSQSRLAATGPVLSGPRTAPAPGLRDLIAALAGFNENPRVGLRRCGEKKSLSRRREPAKRKLIK